MDREFDSSPVKDTCEEYGVHYLNPTRIFEGSDEAETIAWMYRNGKRFHVIEEESDDGTPTRKQIYLPQQWVRVMMTMTKTTVSQKCGRSCAASGSSRMWTR